MLTQFLPKSVIFLLGCEKRKAYDSNGIGIYTSRRNSNSAVGRKNTQIIDPVSAHTNLTNNVIDII